MSYFVFRFLWRYGNSMVRQKVWGRQNATVAALFTRRAERTPDAPCFIVVGDRTWTYKEVIRGSFTILLSQDEYSFRTKGSKWSNAR